MQLDMNKLDQFLLHSDNVDKAATNLPLVINSPTSLTAIQYTQQEINKLHESLFYFKQGKYNSAGSKNMDYSLYEPLALDIADFLNDDNADTPEIQKATEKIIHSFINLFKALNKLIRLNNELPAKDFDDEKIILQSSFTQLTQALGTLLQPLGNHIKDVFEEAVLEGPSLTSLRTKMNTSFSDNNKTLRELLTLDRNSDGSGRNNQFTTLEKKRDALDASQKKRKAQKIREKKARKANRKK
jgi:hypothetical protein